MNIRFEIAQNIQRWWLPEARTMPEALLGFHDWMMRNYKDELAGNRNVVAFASIIGMSLRVTLSADITYKGNYHGDVDSQSSQAQDHPNDGEPL